MTSGGKAVESPSKGSHKLKETKALSAVSGNVAQMKSARFWDATWAIPGTK